MWIKPEVSEIDHTHAVTVAGISVPALIMRKASTTLELRDGQSFMLGGLLQSDGTNDLDQLPWLGDVPVLGALFRSTDYQKNETDLVILVTPHIVKPMTPTDPIHTPLDGIVAAERRRPVPDGQDRGQPGAGAARVRRGDPAVCRPHPRSAEKWRCLCVGQRLIAPRASSRAH